jgi:uncharacterized protein YlaI
MVFTGIGNTQCWKSNAEDLEYSILVRMMESGKSRIKPEAIASFCIRTDSNATKSMRLSYCSAPVNTFLCNECHDDSIELPEESSQGSNEILSKVSSVEIMKMEQWNEGLFESASAGSRKLMNGKCGLA